MRRLGRWLLKILTALSLLLCVATSALWVRSRSTSDTILVAILGKPFQPDVYLPAHYAEFQSVRGLIELVVVRTDGLSISRLAHTHLIDERAAFSIDSSPAEMFVLKEAPLMFIASCRSERDLRYCRVDIRHWFLSVLSATLPILRCLQWASRSYQNVNRVARGTCPSCGYDLTGNVSRVCPECGSPVAPVPSGTSPAAGTPRTAG